MAQVNIRLNLRLGQGLIRWGLVAVMLMGMANELASESLTLSTYYPAPSGVYVNMITTNQTYLARDGGNVAVGTANSQSKLGVSGGVAVGSYAESAAAPDNGFIVSGNVGIGTSSPVSSLEVNGDISLTSTTNRIENVGDPIANSDVATKGWVLAQLSSSGCYTDWSGTCASGFTVLKTWQWGYMYKGNYGFVPYCVSPTCMYPGQLAALCCQ